MSKHKQFHLLVILFYRRMESQINAEALADDNHLVNKVSAGKPCTSAITLQFSQYTYIKEFHHIWKSMFNRWLYRTVDWQRRSSKRRAEQLNKRRVSDLFVPWAFMQIVTHFTILLSIFVFSSKHISLCTSPLRQELQRWCLYRINMQHKW